MAKGIPNKKRRVPSRIDTGSKRQSTHSSGKTRSVSAHIKPVSQEVRGILKRSASDSSVKKTVYFKDSAETPERLILAEKAVIIFCEIFKNFKLTGQDLIDMGVSRNALQVANDTGDITKLHVEIIENPNHKSFIIKD